MYVLPTNDIGQATEILTELKLTMYRDVSPDDPEPEPEPDPESECPDELDAVELPGLITAGALTATKHAAVDPDDPCSVLASWVFSEDSAVYQWHAFTINFEQVENATEYEIVVHPISYTSNELQACNQFVIDRTNGAQTINLFSVQLPISETGAYEFLVRARNNENGCNVSGPWSEVGSLQTVSN